MRPALIPILLAPPGWVLRGAKIDADFAAGRYFGGSLSSLFSITRASTGYAQTQSGLLVPFASGAFRITDKGLLIEEARTNLALRSQEFDNAAWTKVDATVTADAATAPDGTSTADRVQIGAHGQASGAGLITQLIALGGGTSANKIVTVSCWVRSLSGTQNLAFKNTQSAVADHFSDITATTTWTRHTFTVTNSGSAGNGFQNVGFVNHSDGSAFDVYVWGFQAELGSTFTTSYIPTTTASATRAADNVTPSGALASLLAADAGSVILTSSGVGNPAVAPYLLARNSFTETFIRVINTTTFGARIGSSAVATATLGSGSTASTTKFGVGWSAAGVATVANNGTVATTASTFGAASTIKLGSQDGSAGMANGYITRLAAWAARLPDATLKALTA